MRFTFPQISNPTTSARFLAVTNIVVEFNDAWYATRLREMRDYAHTALIETLKPEQPALHWPDEQKPGSRFAAVCASGPGCRAY